MEVHIDPGVLEEAIGNINSLASNIESGMESAQNACRYPPFSSSPISDLSAITEWLRGEVPNLQARVDLARALQAQGDFDGSIEVSSDSNRVIREQLGHELADMAPGMMPHDGERYREFTEMLGRWTDDEVVTSTFYQDLGPEQTLRVLSTMADDVEGMEGAASHEDQQRLLNMMRTALETATHEPGFPDESFAEGLVDAATMPADDYAGRGPMNPHGALTFLLYNGDFDSQFIETMAHDLDQYERVDNSGTRGLWGDRLINGDVYFDNFLPYSAGSGTDPMTSLMSALANDPDVALEFFSDTDAGGDTSRPLYYIRDRIWDGDSFRAISEVLNAATTSPELIDDPNSESAHDAAVLASRVVEYFSDREYVDQVAEKITMDPDNPASENFANIMTTYMAGVDHALRAGAPGDIDTGAGNVYSDAFGGMIGNVPLFDKDGLQTFSLMAMASDDGFAHLREGLNEYRALNLGTVADNLSGDDTSANRSALDAAIAADANLEGFFIEQIGNDKINDGAERDARIEAWVDFGAGAIEALPVPGVNKLGSEAAEGLINMAIGGGISGGSDAIKDALANYEDSARSSSEDLAEETLRQQAILIATLLDERDLSANPDGMSDLARPDGDMISLEELEELSDGEQRQVLSELFSTQLGVGDYFSLQDYEEAYRSEFQEYFNEARAE